MKAWIAIDKDGIINLFNAVPYRTKGYHRWVCQPDTSYMRIKQNDLPKSIDPQWSDEEPIEVKLKIKKVR